MTLLEVLINPRFVRGVLWLLALATPASGAAWAVWASRRTKRNAAGNGGPYSSTGDSYRSTGDHHSGDHHHNHAAAALRRVAENPLFWVLSASGPLVGILWLVFNAIENKLGLDSIAGFLINIALFCAVGFGLSLFLRHGRHWLRPPHRRAAPAPPVTKQP